MDDARALIACVPKNAKETVEVALQEHEGFDLVDVRVFLDVGSDERQPTRKGISLRVVRLPALIAALQKAEAEAQRRGLLPEDE